MINSRVLVFLISVFFNQVVLADEIKWYAQDFKPYAYEKNEVPTGLAVDIAVAMMKQMNITIAPQCCFNLNLNFFLNDLILVLLLENIKNNKLMLFVQFQ